MNVLGSDNALRQGISISSDSNGSYPKFRGFSKIVVLASFLAAAPCLSLHAQHSTNDTGAPNMSGVTDVMPDLKYLLKNDDLAMVQVNQGSDGSWTTSLVTMNTSKSQLSGSPITTVIDHYNEGYFNPAAGVAVSEASGRMYNIKTDTVAILNASNSAPGWLFTMTGSGSPGHHGIFLKSQVPLLGTVFSQVVMGDFNGDGLADPLVFYGVTYPPRISYQKWGMKVLTAADPTKEGSLTEGPELYSDDRLVPVAGTIVVGDFNGNGRPGIAALLNDYQTVAFYSVDPVTLTITKTTTVKISAKIPTIGDFPIVMGKGEVSLAAGKFRQCGGNGSACQANGVTNADLVVFGQIGSIDGNGASNGYSVIPIRITPNSTGTNPFTATVMPMKGATKDKPFFQFPYYSHDHGAMAQSAPIARYPEQTDEQLVLGIKTESGSSYIEIGTFLPDDGLLDTFDWESQTERRYARNNDHLENMWVGNFDNQYPDKSHNPGWQIETYELIGYVNSYDPHINIFNINVPSSFPPTPGSQPTDWLKDQQQSDNTVGVPSTNGDTPSLSFLVPSDVQGRSLRLGTPTVVRIPTHTQPDLVLAIPPMHIDYIAPQDSTLATANKVSGGCTDQTTPCVVNLSVFPSEPPSQGQGFASSFNFTSSANSSSKRSLATSWGVSLKLTVGGSLTLPSYLGSTTLSFKNTTKAVHDGTVKNTYGSYAGTIQSLSATTGLSDYLYFTQKAMNVYYYPVLGCDSTSATDCSVDGKEVPLFVQFSVPDQIRYSDIDGLKQDWYQPVHEPGNLFSYPWSVAQLQGQFSNQVNPLTTSATCMATGSSNSSYSTSWNAGQNHDRSVGTNNSFSDQLSVSYSTSMGSKEFGSKASVSMDIGGSGSINTLNETSSSLSTSKSISVNIPEFGYAAKCCDYAFGGYVYGLTNTKNPASENVCTASQTPDKDGCTAVSDPDTGKPIDIASTGPLFVGFLADPISSVNTTNTDLTCSGSDIWWQRAYTKPDVALNHPGRWTWNKAQRLATFVTANSTPIIEDNYFYLMKGFFVTKKGELTGPNLAEASPSDALTLTSRVYNYSLVTTTAPVHVRFYGQLYCSSSGATEASCKGNDAPCTKPGLCGNSFQIGSDQIIPSIAGFKARGTEPNWTTANVDFLPTSFQAVKSGNAYMVFWVVVWMEDAGGNLVAELPGHGLQSIPASDLKQITNVLYEPYSNNVGMYGVHQRFYICPPAGCAPQSAGLGAPQSSPAIKSISLSTVPQLLLEQRARMDATLQVTDVTGGSVNIAYYDGNPAKGGVLVDVQQIQHMDPGATYAHRTFFTPERCGTHILYASAWVADSPEMQATAMTNVTIDSASFIQALINSTNTANVTSVEVGSNLLALLNTALQAFQQGQTVAGNTALSVYMQQLATSSGKGITANSVTRLTGQARVILGCGSRGFSVSALPSSVTVSVGSAASYALAITPVGGFSGQVSLACLGVPQGTQCSFTSPSLTLNGSDQSTVTATVTSTSQVTGAGINGEFPPDGPGRFRCILMLLLAVLAAVSLQRARVRQTIVCGLIALMLLGGMSGCGGGSRGKISLPPGTYTFTLQATSGNTVLNTPLVLVVK